MNTANPTSGFRPGNALEYSSVELADGILTLTINRPAVHNALHPPACAELGAVLDYAETDESVRVIIVTGAGERAFSAGFDLQFAEAHPELYDDPMLGSEIVRRLDRSKPVIAAVNGLALGLGFEFALACDLIIASGNAKFGLPEPTVGLTAMGGGIVRLTREIGLKRALGMILTSKIVTAEEGYRLGFVTEVVSEPLLQVARRWAEAMIKGAPLSLAASKDIAYRNFDLPDLDTALDPRSYASAMKVLASEDAAEGRRAFVEKRRPVWKNR